MTPEQAFGWALVHFLWQGTGLALLAWLGLRVFERPQTRYVWAVSVMALMALAPVGTFGVLWRERIMLDVPLGMATGVGWKAGGAAGRNVDWIGLAVKGWATGAVLLLMRSFGGWWLARRRTRRGLEGLALEWIERVERLKARMGIRGPLDVFGSSGAAVPQVFGWMRPVLLLPVCTLAGMTPEQVEALIAHELAHVRRHDYVVNLVQTVVESLLFYHPAVWWLSRRIRAERESCCDEAAVEACGDRVLYSTALLRLEESRVEYSMAATGSGLKERIGRLLGMERASSGIGSAVVTALAVLMCGILIWAQETKQTPPAVKEGVAGGVVGGVPGGVGGGVPGGGGVARQESRPERDRELEAMRAQMKQLEKELQKTKVELEFTRQQLKQQSETMAGEVDARQQALKDAERALKDLQQKITDTERKKADVEVLTATLAELHAQQEKQQRQAQEEEKELQRRIQWADERFKEPNMRGSETDRGKVYVKYGPPDEMEVYQGKGEAWRYKKDGTIFKFDGAGKLVK